MRERWEGQMEVASGANHHAEKLVQNANFFFFKCSDRKQCAVCRHEKIKGFTQDDLWQFSCFDWSKLSKEHSLEDQTASIL